MTYGTISEATKIYLLERAKMEAIAASKLGLDFEFPDDTDDPMSHTSALANWIPPDNLFEVTIIANGALDEEFTICSDYEVNIADWLAQSLRGADEIEDWEVIVSEWSYEGGGATRYRTNSDPDMPPVIGKPKGTPTMTLDGYRNRPSEATPPETYLG